MIQLTSRIKPVNTNSQLNPILYPSSTLMLPITYSNAVDKMILTSTIIKLNVGYTLTIKPIKVLRTNNINPVIRVRFFI